MSLAIIGASILFFVGHGLKKVFELTKVPDLLILVIIGYLLGPVFGVLEPETFGEVGNFLSALALIVILYGGGLNLDMHDLKTSSLSALLLSVLGFFGIAILGGGLSYLLLGNWYAAALFGVGIGSTSSAIVIPMVEKLSISQRVKTVLSLESAFTDVLAIVIFLVLIDGIKNESVQMGDMIWGVGPNVLVAIALGLASGFVWSVLRHSFSLQRLRFSGEAWSMLTYGVLDSFGLNGAIGVLSLGFIQANLGLLPQTVRTVFRAKTASKIEQNLLEEVIFLLKTFFFVYLGILIKFNAVKTVCFAAGIALLIFALRFVITRWVMLRQESRLDAMVITAMGPRGLACAVLATLPLQEQLKLPDAAGQWTMLGPWQELQDTIFALIPMTILLTAVLVILSEKWPQKLGGFFPGYEDPQALPTDGERDISG